MKPVRFIHISDPHIAIDYRGTRITRLHDKTGFTLTRQLEIGMEHILNNSGYIDFFIISGDIIHESGAADYKYFHDIFTEMTGGIAFYIALGNHDSDGIWKGWPGAGVKDRCSCYDYFDYNITDPKSGLNIIVLDSRGGPYGSGILQDSQLEWLSQKLLESSDPAIIMMHHTPHISREIPYLVHQMQNSQAFYHVIKGHNIKGIFTGHTHKHFVSMLGDIPCYTAPSITFGIHTDDEYMSWDNITGYNICDYNGDKLSVEYMQIIPRTLHREDILYSELY